MAPRLIIHAGFHKTGTSSVQKMLDQGREALAPALRVLIKDDMPDVCRTARDYAFAPGALELTLFAYEVARLFESLDPADPRPLLVSCEDLAGLIPGRHQRLGYPAVGALMRAMVDTAREAWDRPIDTVLYFSTRAAEPWMRSCYNQHLRVTRITEDYESYRVWQAPHANLAAIAGGVAPAVPGARVHVRPLERTTIMAHGPLSPLLRFAAVPWPLRRKVGPVPRANRSLPEDVQARLLALNRSDLAPEELTERKQALISAARQGKTAAGPGDA